MPNRIHAYLSGTKLGGAILAICGGLGFLVVVLNSSFDLWDNVERMADWNWGWVEPAVTTWPLYAAICALGVVWLAFFGEPGTGGRGFVMLKGLRWEYVGEREPMPFCPKHRVRLLYRSNDPAQWQTHGIENGLWIGPNEGHGYLWCGHGESGHDFRFEAPDWMIGEVAKQANVMLERRSAQATSSTLT